MNTNFKEKFTKWYVKRGYTFGYGPTPVYDDGIFRIPTGMPEPYWDCPWWVKPLLIFFSPSIYMAEAWRLMWNAASECVFSGKMVWNDEFEKEITEIFDSEQKGEE